MHLDFKKNLNLVDRSIRIILGVFLIGLVILQPVAINSTWMMVFAVMGLGMVAEGLNSY
ncbi:MAG: YgaP family membrane protein [Syntrophomonadaceae bacterium]|jgi:hypothetical protein